jgi:hypothetical protein
MKKSMTDSISTAKNSRKWERKSTEAIVIVLMKESDTLCPARRFLTRAISVH